MKLRIIKEKSVYRIQEYKEVHINNSGFHFPGKWIYAGKAIIHNTLGCNIGLSIDFKTEKEAEDFIEHNYVVKVIKEYEVE